MAPDMAATTGDRQPMIRGITALLLALVVMVVTLRFLARYVSRAGLWWDDYLILFGALITVAIDILTFVGVSWGLGLRTAVVVQRYSPENVIKYSQILFSTMLTYQWAMSSIKCSILLLYFRLFRPNRKLRWAVYLLLGFVVLWHISFFFALLFQCTPIDYFWDRTIVGGHCVDHGAINNNALSVSNAATNVFTDFMIIFLPLPSIWQLQLSLYRKLGLVIIFMLGALDCAVSIIRMKELIDGQTEDLLWSNSLPQLWTVIELSIAAICACLPVLVPLFTRYAKSYIKKSQASTDGELASRESGSGLRGHNGLEQMTNASAYAESRKRKSSDEFELWESRPPTDRGITITRDVHQSVHMVDDPDEKMKTKRSPTTDTFP